MLKKLEPKLPQIKIITDKKIWTINQNTRDTQALKPVQKEKEQKTHSTQHMWLSSFYNTRHYLHLGGSLFSIRIFFGFILLMIKQLKR